VNKAPDIATITAPMIHTEMRVSISVRPRSVRASADAEAPRRKRRARGLPDPAVTQ
jgi:hypothetical protein